MIKADFHLHTTYCDGADSPEVMAEAAFRLGCTSIGFSSHVDPGVPSDYAAYAGEIRRLRRLYRGKMDIILGAELDNVITPESAPDAEYRIGSTHFIPVPGCPAREHTLPYGSIWEEEGTLISVDNGLDAMDSFCRKYYGGDYYALAEDYFRCEADVVERTRPAFIGHFDLVLRYNDLPAEEGGHFIDENDPRYLGPAVRTLEHLASYGLPFEVNCGALNRGRKPEPYPSLKLLGILRKMDAELLLSSDAHSTQHILGGFEKAEEFVRSCGFDHVNILTREETDLPAANTCQDPEIAGAEGVPLYWKKIAL